MTDSGNLYWWFERGLMRSRSEPVGRGGDLVITPDGYSARFFIRLADGKVQSASYTCTTCCTLVGLCEHLTQILAGMSFRDARNFRAERLLSFHPELQLEHRSRAHLAVEALRSALQNNTEGECI